MITAILVAMDAETKILKYGTQSEDEACKLLLNDWIEGRIVWDWDDTNKAFNKKWLIENGLEPLSDVYDKHYENGVRILVWNYFGEEEGGDQEITCFLIHSCK